MKIQSEAVTGAQREIHIVVDRQKAGLENVRLEVGKYVIEVLAIVQTTGGSGGGKGGGDVVRSEREGTQLNDPQKNEVEILADKMTKASPVLWRDNLDLHLKGSNDFGMGPMRS